MEYRCFFVCRYVGLMCVGSVMCICMCVLFFVFRGRLPWRVVVGAPLFFSPHVDTVRRPLNTVSSAISNVCMRSPLQRLGAKTPRFTGNIGEDAYCSASKYKNMTILPPLHHAPLLTLRGAQPSGRVDEMNNVVRDLALGCVKVRERQKAYTT